MISTQPRLMPSNGDMDAGYGSELKRFLRNFMESRGDISEIHGGGNSESRKIKISVAENPAF